MIHISRPTRALSYAAPVAGIGAGLAVLGLIGFSAPRLWPVAPHVVQAPSVPPQVWLTSLAPPDVVPFAARDYALEPVLPRVAPRVPPVRAVAPPPVVVLTPPPRTVPEAVAVAEPAPRGLSRSLFPRARPPQPEVTPDVVELVALTPDNSVTRSVLPRARPETVTRRAEPEAALPVLASLGVPVETPREAPRGLSVPAFDEAVASADRCAPTLARAIPHRSGSALSGSAVIEGIAAPGGRARDDAVVAEVLAGNVPDFLRTLVPVTFTSGSGRDRTRITICVTPDYLAVGSDRDFVRVPLGLPAAMRVAERFDMVLPTTRMVDEIHQQASLRLSPSPMDPTSQMASTSYFLRHNATVEQQRRSAGGRLGQLVSGHKKDLVLSNRLNANPGRVAIYGWHRSNGRAIQPLSTVHGAEYADYSHGIRLVSRRAYVNGREVDLRDLLSDTRTAGLISSEGTITHRQMLASLR